MKNPEHKNSSASLKRFWDYPRKLSAYAAVAVIVAIYLFAAFMMWMEKSSANFKICPLCGQDTTYAN